MFRTAASRTGVLHGIRFCTNARPRRHCCNPSRDLQFVLSLRALCVHLAKQGEVRREAHTFRMARVIGTPTRMRVWKAQTNLHPRAVHLPAHCLPGIDRSTVGRATHVGHWQRNETYHQNWIRWLQPPVAGKSGIPAASRASAVLCRALCGLQAACACAASVPTEEASMLVKL